MDQKNILPRGIAKPIEQQPDGTWIVRHHFRVVGTSENGEELVTFASSEYPEKPTLQQIQRSIDRYRVCLTMYGDTISDEIEKVDLSGKNESDNHRRSLIIDMRFQSAVIPEFGKESVEQTEQKSNGSTKRNQSIHITPS